MVSMRSSAVVIGREGPQHVDAVVGTVEGGDADRDVPGSCRGHVGSPLGALDRDLVRPGDDVEPVPAAVAEVASSGSTNSTEPAPFDVLLVDPLLVAAGVGPVDQDVTGARDLHRQA